MPHFLTVFSFSIEPQVCFYVGIVGKTPQKKLQPNRRKTPRNSAGRCDPCYKNIAAASLWTSLVWTSALCQDLQNYKLYRELPLFPRPPGTRTSLRWVVRVLLNQFSVQYVFVKAMQQVQPAIRTQRLMLQIVSRLHTRLHHSVHLR